MQKVLTYHSTAHIAVIKLCTNDAEIFLHFHAFLPALSGMGTLLIPVLTSLKNPTEHPVVKTTELNSIAEKYMKNRKNSQVTAASLSAVINKPWNYLIPIERIRILDAMNPSDPGFTCRRRRGGKKSRLLVYSRWFVHIRLSDAVIVRAGRRRGRVDSPLTQNFWRFRAAKITCPRKIAETAGEAGQCARACVR